MTQLPLPIRRPCRILPVLMAMVCLLLTVSTGARAEPMEFTFQRSDHRNIGFGLNYLIFGSGEITPGTAARLQDFVRRNNIVGGVKTLYLSSPGGSLMEGLTLGRYLRVDAFGTGISSVRGPGKDLDTGPAECLSACTLAFLGGVERHLPMSGSVFGVHRFYFTGGERSAQDSDIAQMISSQVVAYLREMDVDTGFFTEMTRAGRQEINALSAARMQELNVTTPDYRTVWDTATANGQPYVKATTTDRRGTHKLLFSCGGARLPPALMVLVEAGSEVQRVASSTAVHQFMFSPGGDVELISSELIHRANPMNAYVETLIRLTPRLLAQFRQAQEVTFAMIPEARRTYVGFTVDMRAGRQRLYALLDHCP